MVDEKARQQIADQASRLMAAGWRGNPNMSGDDRDFMPPSMRRKHDDKARAVVDFVLSQVQALSPGSTGEREDLDAMPLGEDFLAENRFGDWLTVRRFDPKKPDDFSGNAVVNGRTGRWWYPLRWRPLPAPPGGEPAALLRLGSRLTVDGVEAVVVTVEPNSAQLDRAVAFALTVSLGGDYRWTDYMRDLYRRFLSAAGER